MPEVDLSRPLFSGLRQGRPVLFVCVDDDQFAIVHGDSIVRRGTLDVMPEGIRQFMEFIDRPPSVNRPGRLGVDPLVRCA